MTLVYIRQDSLFYKIKKTSTLAFYEVMANAYELALQASDISSFILDRSLLQKSSLFSDSSLSSSQANKSLALTSS